MSRLAPNGGETATLVFTEWGGDGDAQEAQQLASGRSSSRTRSLPSGAAKPRPGWAAGLEAASRVDRASCARPEGPAAARLPLPTPTPATDPGEVPPKLQHGDTLTARRVQLPSSRGTVTR